MHVKYCKKCEKPYDTMSCPYCNKEKMGPEITEFPEVKEGVSER